MSVKTIIAAKQREIQDAYNAFHYALAQDGFMPATIALAHMAYPGEFFFLVPEALTSDHKKHLLRMIAEEISKEE